MAYTANHEQVFSPLEQSGVSNCLPLVKEYPLFDQSAFSNFAFYDIYASYF